jgi:RNA polymerase primary sigma factor
MASPDTTHGHGGRRAEPAGSFRDAAARQRQVLRSAQRGDRRARARLVSCHLALVRAVASHYRGLGVPFDDLVQEGSLGLLEAIERYDSRRGVPFEAFARFRVRRAVRNALTEQARLVRLPKQMVERRRLLDRVEARLVAARGRPPAPEELAAETGLSVDAVLEAQAAAITPLSLDDTAGPDGTTLEGVIPDAAASDPVQEAIAAEESRRLHAAMTHLSSRQREIVARHFGFDEREEALSEVAADLELSERRTRTIEHDALYRLARELDSALSRSA